jgi:hypothetical protein
MINHLVGANGYAPAIAIISSFAHGAGAASSPVSVTFSNFVDRFGNGLLPSNGGYAVAVSPSQACAISVRNKSPAGFTITLTPALGSIADGAFDVIVLASMTAKQDSQREQARARTSNSVRVDRITSWVGNAQRRLCVARGRAQLRCDALGRAQPWGRGAGQRL